MIIPPDHCPSCSSSLEWQNDTLYCRNNECPAKSSKQVEHFAKTLKIKGLGPAAIDKLDLTSINDIYDMNLEFMTLALGSEKLAVKLFEEIEKSKNEPLNTVLPAFGIPLVGKSATDKLAATVESLFEIDEASCKKAGLGNVATTNLTKWIDESFEKYSHLPFSFEFNSVASSTTSSKGTICISGKLKSFKTKQAAKEVLESLGYKVTDSLTKDVTILVNESGVASAKTEKAEKLGIQITTDLKSIIGE